MPRSFIAGCDVPRLSDGAALPGLGARNRVCRALYRFRMPMFQKRKGPLVTFPVISLRERILRPSKPVWTIQRAEIKVRSTFLVLQPEKP